jgi:hypothetical protein
MLTRRRELAPVATERREGHRRTIAYRRTGGDRRRDLAQQAN